MHPLLRAAADRQLGLFTALDARRAGYEPGEVRRLCASGAWLRLRRGRLHDTAELAVPTSGDGGTQLDCLAVLLDLGRPAAAISHGVGGSACSDLPARRRLPDPVRLTHPDAVTARQGFT